MAVFYGWWIVLACFVVAFYMAGTVFYSFTAFFNPLVQEFKWNYAATSFATSFRSLESGIASPVVGFLTDRYGPRKLIFFGSIWSGIGCMMLSRIDSLMSFYVTFIFLSAGSSMMFPIPGWTTVTHWFRRKRGVAMGVLVAAIGFSGVLIPLVTRLIDVGIGRSTAGALAGSLVISSVLGRMGFGWLGDRFDKRHLLMICMILQLSGILIFAYTVNVIHALVFLILYGPGFGGVITLRLTMQGDYFGRTSFGSIQGIMQGLHLVGTIVSPVFAGWIFDLFASYRPAWLTMAGMTFLAIPLILMLKPPQRMAASTEY